MRQRIGKPDERGARAVTIPETPLDLPRKPGPLSEAKDRGGAREGVRLRDPGLPQLVAERPVGRGQCHLPEHLEAPGGLRAVLRPDRVKLLFVTHCG